MAAAIGAVAAEDRHAGKGEIADGVEHLVADEFVGEAEAFRVDDAVFADNHGVIERGAEREAAGPELLDIGQEAEGAGTGDIAAEAFRADVGGEMLAADQRVFEIDLDLDAAAVVRHEFGVRLTDIDAHRLDDLEVADAGGEVRDAGMIDGVDESAGAAIHDRDFRSVDLDVGIVDLKGG